MAIRKGTLVRPYNDLYDGDGGYFPCEPSGPDYLDICIGIVTNVNNNHVIVKWVQRCTNLRIFLPENGTYHIGELWEIGQID